VEAIFKGGINRSNWRPAGRISVAGEVKGVKVTMGKSWNKNFCLELEKN